MLPPEKGDNRLPGAGNSYIMGWCLRDRSDVNEICPICNRRKAERFCPAKGEKICAICCGTGREVTIDCTPDCSYLSAARRREADHRKPIPAAELPYANLRIPLDLIQERAPVLAGLCLTIVEFAAENRGLHDADLFASLEPLAESYRTLDSGLYYERLPQGALAHALYQQLAGILEKYRNNESRQPDAAALKVSEIFPLLAFIVRLGRQEANGRPLSRAFLDFLRREFPQAPERRAEASLIILP